MRKGAAIALGKIGERQAVPFLAEALSDDEWVVRSAAAEALGTLHDTRAVPSLIEALNDQIYDVRIAAATSLSELGGPEGCRGTTPNKSRSARCIRYPFGRADKARARRAA